MAKNKNKNRQNNAEFAEEVTTTGANKKAQNNANQNANR